MRVTVVTFCVSLVISTLEIANFVQMMAATPDDNMPQIVAFGAVSMGCWQLVIIAIYVGVILFLRSATTRAEWEDAAQQRLH